MMETQTPSVWFDAAEALFSSGPGDRLLNSARKGLSANVFGLPDPAKSFMIAALSEKENKRACVLVPDEARARALYEELSALLDPESILTFRGREYSLVHVQAASRELELERTAVLFRLLTGDYKILIVTAQAALQRLRTPGFFQSFEIPLKTGDEIEPEELEKKLVLAGYERIPQIEAPGQFARRGDILDIWPPGRREALRISFFDILVDELKSLDPDSQRSLAAMGSCLIPPARELPLLEHEWAKTAGKVRELCEDYYLQAARAGLKPEEMERLRQGGNRDIERLDQSLYFPSLERWLPVFEASKIYILSRPCPRNVLVLAASLDIEFSFVTSRQFHKHLYKQNLLMEKIKPIKTKRQRRQFSDVLWEIFQKRRAKYFFMSAITFGLFLLITPFKLYYLIMLSIVLCLGVICLFRPA